MRFALLPEGRPTDGRHDEDLIDLAIRNGPVARIWTAGQGLVVPRTYTHRPGFDTISQAFAARDWPIAVRLSGGGVVPQGPGILNLSLAFPVEGRAMTHSEAAYLLICRIISAALSESGIAARAEAVEGSFCDGRFNLAVGRPARKVAGTAQVWRRVQANPEIQIGLVHALILAQVDTARLTDQANRLEEALGNARRYRPDRIASLNALVPAQARAGFTDTLREGLVRALEADWALRHPGHEAPA